MTLTARIDSKLGTFLKEIEWSAVSSSRGGDVIVDIMARLGIYLDLFGKMGKFLLLFADVLLPIEGMELVTKA